MRHYLMLLLVALACVGCSGVEVLEPAHELAVENQKNLESNVQEVLKQLLGIARSHQDYEAEKDEPVLEDMARTLTEQVAISTAYVALIGAYIDGKELDADAFRTFLQDIPDMVRDGVNLWDALQELLKEDD